MVRYDTLCRKVFPQASVSSGGHNLINAIVPSIPHLESACSETGVEFIDKLNTFIAGSGAPRLLLYKDIIHPSAKGIARLAANLTCIHSTKHSYTPRDDRNFHFQMLRADESMLQKRNAYKQQQDGHDFKRQRGDSSVQRHRDDFYDLQ